MKTKFTVVFALLLCLNFAGYAQRSLTETETQWINEAKENLKAALSDISMPENERLETIRKSAKTLKEYGQESEWPEGEIPLEKLMNENFDQCKDQITEMSAWTLHLENQSLDQKLRLINAIQIEVVEDQVQMLVPGSTPVQLSGDVISTVFGVNIVEGIHGGKRQDAQDLTNRFMELAKTNKLVNHINILIKHDKESLRMIDKDRKELAEQIPAWEKAYADAEAGTFTMKGYEGAVPANNQNESNSHSSNPNSITGTWKFGYEQTGYFIWTFKSNGEFTFEDRMNGGDVETGKYTVMGNMLKISGPKHICESVEGNYYFRIEDGDLEFTKIEDECIQRQFTLRHIWSKD